MIIHSPQEMYQLGEEISKKNQIIFLYGDLGAGKTLFTQGFVYGLTSLKNIVQSPTYTYINIYEDKILHIDMYRLEEFDDFVNKGILEQIHNFDYIVIERPKFVEKLGLKNILEININKISETEREVIMTNK